MLKRTFLSILIFVTSSSIIQAQQNAITIDSFTVKKQLPPIVKQWAGIPKAMQLVATNESWGNRPVRLFITIKKGSNKICGNENGIPVDTFKTRSFNTVYLLPGLANCTTLQPGDYTICVRFRGMSDTHQWVDISSEICSPFRVPSSLKIFSSSQSSMQ